MLDRLQKYVYDGYISKRKHPRLDLYIYNYTVKTTIENEWNEITTMARGLILNSAGDIIARPFGKFFNYGQLASVGIRKPTKQSWTMYEKMEVREGILY